MRACPALRIGSRLRPPLPPPPRPARQLTLRCAPAAYLNDRTLGYTVFAPTNEAIANAFAMLDTNLTDVLYSGHLDALLQYHFLQQPYTVRCCSCRVAAPASLAALAPKHCTVRCIRAPARRRCHTWLADAAAACAGQPAGAGGHPAHQQHEPDAVLLPGRQRRRDHHQLC